jgi:Flp pilus assembly protein TadD
LGRRRYPFLLVGWLWFVGTLVPVIGLVQVGKQAIADRYAYIPSLGLLILVIWGAHELTRRWRFPKFALVASGAALIFLCLVLTRQQLGYWKNSETLFRHTLAVTKDNFFIDYNLGVILYNQGQTREATELFQETIRIAPNYADAHVNLGVALLNQGQTVEAIRQFQEAIRFRPDDEDAYYNLGVAFLNHGRTDEAIRELQAALRLNPNDTDAKNKLAGALELKNK